MSKKWTKGPWFAITCPHDERRHLRIDSNPGAEWASCSQIAYAKPSDAHLIAAAPEMCEALEELVGLVKAIREDEYEVDSLTTQPGELALKKARGEK